MGLVFKRLVTKVIIANLQVHNEGVVNLGQNGFL